MREQFPNVLISIAVVLMGWEWDVNFDVAFDNVIDFA
jgi:hypothetical protein